MKRSVVVLMFCILFSAKSQKVKFQMDSLRSLAALRQVPDSVKVDLWNGLAGLYLHSDIKKAMTYVDSSVHLAKNIPYGKGTAKAMGILAMGMRQQGDFLAALHYSRMAHTAYVSFNDSEGAAMALLNMATVLNNTQQVDLAYQKCTEALRKIEKASTSNMVALAYLQMGDILISKGKQDQAKKYLTQAFEVAVKKEDTYAQALGQYLLGKLYYTERKMDVAADHIHRSMVLESKFQDLEIQVNNLMTLSQISDQKGEFKSSESYLRTALEGVRNTGFTVYRLKLLRQLLALKHIKDNPRKSHEYQMQYQMVMDSLQWNSYKRVAELEMDVLEMNNFGGKLSAKDGDGSKTVLTGIGIGVFFSTGIFFLGWAIRRKKIHKEMEMVHLRNDFSQQQLKISKGYKRSLIQELETRNKELTSYALNLAQKKQALKKMESLIIRIRNTREKEIDGLMKQLLGMVQQQLYSDKDWEDFKMAYERVHAGFYTKLLELHPELSSNDLKICSLIRLNLNIKEAAQMMGISPNSVKMARYRLRKKFDLRPDQELVTYLIAVENDAVMGV
jgi:tetratricopeptide (TPR) repeat protein